jgi:hypothetical protein
MGPQLTKQTTTKTMKRKIIGIITVAVAVAVLAGCAEMKESKDEGDEAVSMSAVPAPVKQTLAQYTTDSDVKKVEQGDQDGTKVYEFDITQGARSFELTITPDGKFMGMEEDVKLADLPQAAQDALKAQAQGGTLESFEKAVDQNHKTTYEGVINKVGKKTEVAVDENGKVVSTEAVGKGD